MGAFDVAIVGGGPVGLFLACRLAQLGIEPLVLEKRLERSPHSRAIGLHPVSLELLDGIGVADTLISAGIKVRRGHALSHLKEPISTLSFESLPPPFPFVLSLPQSQTEAALEQCLLQLAPRALRRGATFTAALEGAEGVRLFTDGNDMASCRYLIGCDGKQSPVRQAAGIAFRGAPYPDTFLMGDCRDNTHFGTEAAIFLHPEGLVESFPLPGGLRRWVTRVEVPPQRASSAQLQRQLEATVEHRTGQSLHGLNWQMSSLFGVQHFLAETFAQRRVAIAGDAAHVVSPIGGQGMNLGFKDAAELAAALADALKLGQQSSLARYSDRARNRALKATRRSAFFMRLGGVQRLPKARNLLVKAMLAKPLAPLSARLFTMHLLESAPF